MQPQAMLNNFTDEAGFGQEQVQTRSDSDPRPAYLFSAGDHIHRVAARDSVPHVFAGRVQVVKNHIQWIDSATSMTDGVKTREIVRNGKLVQQAGLPLWAGSIVNNVLHDHADLLVTTIEAFEALASEEVNQDRFNCLISGNDSFPYVIEPDWRVRDRKLNPLVPPVIDDWKRTPKKYLDLANEKGGLAIRRALVVEGAKEVNGNALYRSAIEEILAAYDRFISHGHLYLDEQERQIQSAKRGEKAAYDPFDRYLLWLLGRKGIETVRGVTRDDMESLINSVKAQPQQAPMTRDDIAAIASAAARAAVESLPQPVTMTGPDSFEPDTPMGPEETKPRGKK